MSAPARQYPAVGRTCEKGASLATNALSSFQIFRPALAQQHHHRPSDSTDHDETGYGFSNYERPHAPKFARLSNNRLDRSASSPA
jgi:hypothetical protein